MRKSVRRVAVMVGVVAASSIGTANDKASSAFNPMALGAYRAYMNTEPGPSPVGSWEDIVSSVHWCPPR